MKINQLKSVCLLLVLPLVVCIGCETARPKYVDPPNSLVSPTFNNNDCLIAVTKLTNDLINEVLNNQKLPTGSDGKAKLFISTITNNSGVQLDIDLITGKVTTLLEKTGKIEVYATDIATRDGFTANNDITPDLTLSGRVIGEKLIQGNDTQNTYVVQLSLNSATRGVRVWSGEETIIKVIPRSGLGW